ncbi:hypothetical protein ACFL1Q_01555 [Patescibacteria group bacterium]
MKKIFKRKHLWPLVIVFVMGILASRTLLFQKGYFNMHDDLQMMRQLEMEKCFIDGQIPCRWVPDMGYGYGFPLFNFYPPLPYLVGEIFRVIGFSFVAVAKLIFALAIIASGITMYFFANDFFLSLSEDKRKVKYAAIVSSAFYIWAPYHAVDVYVRGAMNEAWAFIWFPLILLTGKKVIEETKKQRFWIIGLALSWFGLLTSHNLMVMIFTPVFGFWCLFFLWRLKKWRSIPRLFTSGLLAFGLAAFFTLPAVFEQKYVQVNTLVTGYYEYIAHYVTMNQLFISRFWGYGPSVWGENDGMPFQIGYAHWILSLFIAAWIIYKLLKKKFNLSFIPIVYFLAVGWFAAFMAHVRSTPIWLVVPPLDFVQFPWRFLTLVVLSFSIISGFVVFMIPKKLPCRVGLIVMDLVLIVVALSWNYFLPQGGKMGTLTDKEKFSAAAWDLQRTAGIFDYLPTTAKQNPKEPPEILAEAVDAEAVFTDLKQGTNWARFDINSDNDLLVRVNIFKFPNWKSYVDGAEVPNFVPEDELWGRMYVNIPKGQHKVYLKLYNTPLRTLANTISVLTWFGLITFPLWASKMLQSKVWLRRLTNIWTKRKR